MGQRVAPLAGGRKPRTSVVRRAVSGGNGVPAHTPPLSPGFLEPPQTVLLGPRLHPWALPIFRSDRLFERKMCVDTMLSFRVFCKGLPFVRTYPEPPARPRWGALDMALGTGGAPLCGEGVQAMSWTYFSSLREGKGQFLPGVNIPRCWVGKKTFQGVRPARLVWPGATSACHGEP